MGSGNTKEEPRQIPYQKDFLGACWDSPYGSLETTHYLPSRWMGISKPTMELYTGNVCLSVRSLYVEDAANTVIDLDRGKPRMAGFQVQPSTPLGVCEEGGGGPEGWGSNLREGNSPIMPWPAPPNAPHLTSVDTVDSSSQTSSHVRVRQGEAKREKVTRVPQPRFVTRRILHAFKQSVWGGDRGGDPTLGGAMESTRMRMRMIHNQHPYLQVNHLSVRSGVLFRVAPACRRYDCISFVQAPEPVVNTRPSRRDAATREETSNADPRRFTGGSEKGEAGPRQGDCKISSPLRCKGLTSTLPTLPSSKSAMAQPNKCLEDATNYSIEDVDVPEVTATVPPVIVGSISALELLSLPPAAEIAFGGWLYISLHNEQQRLHKEIEAYTQKRSAQPQGWRPNASPKSSDMSPLTVNTSKDNRTGKSPDSTRMVSPRAVTPHARARSVGCDEDYGPFSLGKDPANQRGKREREELWLPYVYVVIALPMYECAIHPSACFLAMHPVKPISLNIRDETSRRAFGVGCITRVRYGGVMIIECRDRFFPDRVEDMQWIRHLFQFAQKMQERWKTSPNGEGPHARISPTAPSRVACSTRGRDFVLLKQQIQRRLCRAGFHVVSAATRDQNERAGSRKPPIRQRSAPLSLRAVRCAPSRNHKREVSTPKQTRSDGDSDSNSLEMSSLQRASPVASSSSASSASDESVSRTRQSNTVRHRQRFSFARKKTASMIRGTFRQLGGMRSFEANDLFEGCRLSKVAKGVERWIQSLIKAPVRARPLSIYLQRYEGLANALRYSVNAMFSGGGMGAMGPEARRGRYATAYPLNNNSFMFNSFAGKRAFEVATPTTPQVATIGSGMNGVSKGVTSNNTKEAMDATSKPSLSYFLNHPISGGASLFGYSYYTGPLAPIVVPVLPPELATIITEYPRPDSSNDKVGAIEGPLAKPHGEDYYNHRSNAVDKAFVLAEPSISEGECPDGEEAEWVLADRHLRNLRADLDEVQLLVSCAITALHERLREYITIGSLFLPHTRSDQLEPSLLFLQALRYIPEDVPMRELHTDWLPTLLALLTTPPSGLYGAEGEVQSGAVVLPYINMVDPNDVCDLNKRREPYYYTEGTKYIIEQVPTPALSRGHGVEDSGARLLHSKRREYLREITIAPLAYRLSPSMVRMLERSGVDSGLSFRFTGGSLGVLAGLMYYYSWFAFTSFKQEAETALQRCGGEWGKTKLCEGDWSVPSVLDMMERRGYVILRRISLWGAVEGKKNHKKLEDVQNMHNKYCSVVFDGNLGSGENVHGSSPSAPLGDEYDTDSNLNLKTQITQVELQELMEMMDLHATKLGIPFRSAECVALFEAIAYYLHALDSLQDEYRRLQQGQEFSKAFRTMGLLRAPVSPFAGPPDPTDDVRVKHAREGLLKYPSLASSLCKPFCASRSISQNSDSLRRGIPPPVAAAAADPASEAAACPGETFELCIVTNHYEKGTTLPCAGHTLYPNAVLDADNASVAKASPVTTHIGVERSRRWGLCCCAAGDEPKGKKRSATDCSDSSKAPKKSRNPNERYFKPACAPEGVAAMLKLSNQPLYKNIASISSRWSGAMRGTEAFYCGGEEKRVQTAPLKLWRKESRQLFEFLVKCLNRCYARKVKGKDTLAPYLQRIHISAISEEKL